VTKDAFTQHQHAVHETRDSKSVSDSGFTSSRGDKFGAGFTVKIIPYTLEHTNMGSKIQNDTVNLEFDILVKYLERLIS
jgi:riboflavin synthase